MYSNIVFDNRWCANHGIGRFANEILSNNSFENFHHQVNGSFDSIFSPWDPFRLYFRCALNNFWFLSPSYNCPILWSSKSIITIHDLMHIKFPEYAGFKNKIYYQFLVRSVCRKSPLVFTVSEYTKSEIVKWAGISPDKIVVVYNGVDEKYHPNVSAHQHDRPYFFYIGDKKPHKNIERLLMAFSQSRAQSSYDLLLSGNENTQILEWAKKLGIVNRIKFAGFIPEEKLPGYFKGASALMFPSLFEGFGLPIIESMAVGTPVLTSNVTAMPEIAGDAALLVNPESVEDIALGIDRIVSDDVLRANLIEKGLERVKFFDWNKSRQIWNESINNVIGSN